jgi:hypothetical protein
VPEVDVARGPGGVRPDERDGRGHEEEDAARRLDAEEALQRARRESRKPEEGLPRLRRRRREGAGAR